MSGDFFSRTWNSARHAFPARYNTKTELGVEIRSGVRTYDFALEK
jgi:hypothetical protein